jgi:hypothetical protein
MRYRAMVVVVYGSVFIGNMGFSCRELVEGYRAVAPITGPRGRGAVSSGSSRLGDWRVTVV